MKKTSSKEQSQRRREALACLRELAREERLRRQIERMCAQAQRESDRRAAAKSKEPSCRRRVNESQPDVQEPQFPKVNSPAPTRLGEDAMPFLDKRASEETAPSAAEQSSASCDPIG